MICLVLNVGDQCMGSVYKDPKSAMDTTTTLRLRSMVKTQRSFDKAYKHSIRLFLLSLAVLPPSTDFGKTRKFVALFAKPPTPNKQDSTDQDPPKTG